MHGQGLVDGDGQFSGYEPKGCASYEVHSIGT